MNKKLLTIPLIAIVILIAGFYLVLNNLNELQTDLKNLKLAVELISKQKEQSTTPVPTAPESATPAPTPAVITSVSIPTSILFTTLSGQALWKRGQRTMLPGQAPPG